jgi:hypothetical protein
VASWLLVGILVEGLSVYVKPLGVFVEMNDCFETREFVLAQAEQPKINYEVVCVKIDKKGA